MSGDKSTNIKINVSENFIKIYSRVAAEINIEIM